MKHRFTHIILTAGLSAMLGSLVLSAQEKKETATIPFAFEASGRILPAGDYTVSEHSARGVFVLRNTEGDALFVNAPMNDKGAADNPRLTFNCYGNDRILSEIWTDDGSGYSVTSSKKYLKRRMQMAALVSVSLHR